MNKIPFMNSIYKNAAIFVILPLLLASRQGYSQHNSQHNLAYLPEYGFWQLVNEKHQKRVTTVQFYTEDKELMYQEKVKGVRFNMKKTRTSRWLKEGLDKARVVWAPHRKAIFNQEWMADIVRH